MKSKVTKYKQRKIQCVEQISKNKSSGDGERQHVTIYKEKWKD